MKKNTDTQSIISFNSGALLFFGSLFALISLLSFAYGDLSDHWLGMIGYSFGWIITALFGVTGYLLTFYIGWIGWRKWWNKPLNTLYQKHAAIALIGTSIALFLSVIEVHFPSFAHQLGTFFYTMQWQYKLHFHLGGAPIYFLYEDFPTLNLHSLISPFGVTILSIAGLTASILSLKKVSFSDLKHFAQNSSQLIKLPKREPKKKAVILKTIVSPPPPISEPDITLYKQIPSPTFPPPTKEDIRQRAIEAQKVYNGDLTGYRTPKETLLTDPTVIDQSELKNDLKNLAEILEDTLLSFGIEAQVGQINCGPTITSFEVHPAVGVKVQKIKALENDIALNMKAKSIRILAPIPGKAAVGIEVPNPNPQQVSFKEMLTAYQKQKKKLQIPVLLGKKVNGECVTEDLARMPHLIIAGATGSGKSVCINTIVMSILMTSKPDEIKLIMVDPKKVELTAYSKLPHMLAPVITEPAGACAALNWLVKEMEKRYELLKEIGFRNIASFNERKIDKAFEESLGKEVPERLPYIVCIIDELADLMMVASNEIETHIARIAQMARAVGIHLILATQRPSREVITGLIKANFPTRIAFKVSSRINSQIILDEVGAETLLGWGDLLFLAPGSHHLIRAQGAYLSDEDILSVVNSITGQCPPNYVINSFDDYDQLTQSLGGATGGSSDNDPLYEEALDVILATGNASTTFLQRKLKIGYARAASIIDQLENNRVIGPQDGSKARKILVPLEMDD